jgi:hypothetical protein
LGCTIRTAFSAQSTRKKISPSGLLIGLRERPELTAHLAARDPAPIAQSLSVVRAFDRATDDA